MSHPSWPLLLTSLQRQTLFEISTGRSNGFVDPEIFSSLHETGLVEVSSQGSVVLTERGRWYAAMFGLLDDEADACREQVGLCSTQDTDG